MTFDLTPPGLWAYNSRPTRNRHRHACSIFDEHGIDAGTAAAEIDPRSPAARSSICRRSKPLAVSNRWWPSASNGAANRSSSPTRRKTSNTSSNWVAVPIFTVYRPVDAALSAVQAREALNLPGQMIKTTTASKPSERVGSVLKATDIEENRTVVLKSHRPLAPRRLTALCAKRNRSSPWIITSSSVRVGSRETTF